MKVINKPTKKAEIEDPLASASALRNEVAPRIDKNSVAMNQVNQILNGGAQKRATEVKPTALAGSGIVGGTKMYGDVSN